MKFGDYIRQQRENAGWTQPEAAAKIDIEQSYLSKLETGKSYPSEEVFEKLKAAYGLVLKEICERVGSEELDKLKEIADVRHAILNRERTEKGFMRSWLIAGLVMVMLGGAALGLTQVMPDKETKYYRYVSKGVIAHGEDMAIYEMLQVGQLPSEDAAKLAKRVDYVYKTATEYRGGIYVEQVDGGFRSYSLYDDGVEINKSPFSWIGMPGGLMFLIGGLACFYIARRWR